ncbi:MAG: aldehyde dehydrogenase family protein, partial [Planctomycetota bacterium]
IRPPAGGLARGLTELAPGESWLVPPRVGVEGNPHLVAPGVKWGVAAGGLMHGTEFFGPLLGVMAADDLPHAIDLVRATGYGLTSGLESLDEREQTLWREAAPAGNLYINRPTTGAIVRRQPFGGMGKSNVGPGLKAGGPNYVAQLMSFDAESASDATRRVTSPSRADDRVAAFCDRLAGELGHAGSQRLRDAAASYAAAFRKEFACERDPSRLLGEDNFHRYRPAGVVRVRLSAGDTLLNAAMRVAAAGVIGSRVVLSADRSDVDSNVVKQLTNAMRPWVDGKELSIESDDELADRIRHGEQQPAGQTERVWYAGPDRVPEVVRRAAAEQLAWIADRAPTGCGRLDLLWLVQEQTVSHVYHRYGNLGRRSEEPRAPVR